MARFLQNSLLQLRWSREETLKQLHIVKEIAFYDVENYWGKKQGKRDWK